MSLGIYDAFIFDRSYTMEELTKKIDILRKDVKKTIDIQLHKYVLEKFLYCYFLRENKRYYLWEKAIGPDYTIHNHGFMMNLYDTSMELFRSNFPFYRESVPDYDDILYRLMDTLYPDIEGDQWEDKWNELKRNCPKMDMDGIGQIFDLTERRS